MTWIPFAVGREKLIFSGWGSCLYMPFVLIGWMNHTLQIPVSLQLFTWLMCSFLRGEQESIPLIPVESLHLYINSCTIFTTGSLQCCHVTLLNVKINNWCAEELLHSFPGCTSSTIWWDIMCFIPTLTVLWAAWADKMQKQLIQKYIITFLYSFFLFFLWPLAKHLLLHFSTLDKKIVGEKITFFLIQIL